MMFRLLFVAVLFLGVIASPAAAQCPGGNCPAGRAKIEIKVFSGDGFIARWRSKIQDRRARWRARREG